MKLNTLVLGAALSVAPIAAFAVTAPVLDNITDGGVTTLTSGSFHSFEYTEADATGGAQSFTYEFTADANLGALAGIDINAVPANGITGLFVKWLAADGVTVDAEWDGVSDLLTTSFGAGVTKYLNIGWATSKQGGDVDVNIQAVPVPAGILLLGTALIGMGALRRKG